MPKCQTCNKRKPKKQMITNATCNSCYIDVSLSSKPDLIKSNCKYCKTEYKTKFISDNGYCTDHYYIEQQEEPACRKCTECKQWFCTRLTRTKCDTCYYLI